VTVTNLLITGASGVGKSTLLRRAAEHLDRAHVKGFFSDSMWEADGKAVTLSERRLRDGDGVVRVGWRLEAADGSDGGIVAHPDIESAHRMGRYGIDQALMERIVLAQLTPIDLETVYFIDEIGAVGAFWSPAAFETLVPLLDSPARVIAIVRQREDPSEPGQAFLTAVKTRADAQLITVTIENRDTLVDTIVEWASGRSLGA
jgi:nucleoside-triphosphatase THEP1